MSLFTENYLFKIKGSRRWMKIIGDFLDLTANFLNNGRFFLV